jgi:EAL domain-containing protein (putative c-di-GMP-specific phosphodiesterase class I)
MPSDAAGQEASAAVDHCRVDTSTPTNQPTARETVEAVLADPSLIRPVFQPIVDLRRSAVQGYEMLARLANDPAGTPLQWLAAAERHGLGNALEASLVAAGIHAREHLPRGTYLSINISPGALVSADVRAVLDAAPGGLDQIVVEVTEQKPVENYDELATVLDRARQAGARVAVDDAGAGYASLQHVLKLRPEYVKLDRGLIADADADPAKLALIEAVGLFAGRLDAALVAEGIERRAEQETLAGLAVPLGQGYLFGRPGPSLVRDVPIAGLRSVTGALSSLIDGPPPAVLDAGLLEVGAEPPASARGQVVVVLDRLGRPTGLLVPEGGGWAHRERPLTASLDEPALSVARRALARPNATRLDPVCACLPDGRLAGLVGVERLLGDEAGATDASFLLPAGV